MVTDARGGLWIEGPLLAFGLLSSLWVLVAYLHTSWAEVGRARSGGHGHLRQFGEGVLDRLGRIGVILQRASEVGVIGAHIEVAMARQVEQDHPPLTSVTRGKRFVDGGTDGVRRL